MAVEFCAWIAASVKMSLSLGSEFKLSCRPKVLLSFTRGPLLLFHHRPVFGKTAFVRVAMARQVVCVSARVSNHAPGQKERRVRLALPPGR